MPTEFPCSEGAISGNVIHLGEGRRVAIYQRDGVCWVADFQGSTGQLVDAASWFRFHAGVLRYSHGRRRAALDAMTPISPELAAQIQLLHRSRNAAPERPKSFLASVVARGLVGRT